MLRRSFLSRLTSAAAVFGLAPQAAPQAPAAPAAPAAPGRAPFEPARYAKDDWYDAIPGKHRVVFDSFMADRFPEAVQFAGNIYRASMNDYGVTEKEMAVILVVRHQTMPFALNDAMWAKYGRALADRAKWVDPATKQIPSTNIYGRQIGNLVKNGMHFAICNLTTRAYTTILAQQTGKSTDDIYAELTANTLGNAHFVPAGVVGVLRAQEHGYRLVSVGG